MDIRDWPLDQIMQLPDCCFGSRFVLVVGDILAAAERTWAISHLPLPDKCVLWQMQLLWRLVDPGDAPTTVRVEVALGDQLPLTREEFFMLEQVFPGAEVVPNEKPFFRYPFNLTRIRMPIVAQGRRIVCELRHTSLVELDVACAFVFSSIPTEVPDWLLSEYLRSR